LANNRHPEAEGRGICVQVSSPRFLVVLRATRNEEAGGHWQTFEMQLSPAGQSLFWVHCGFASAALAQ
jgi:hypothetical protein